MIDGKKYVIPEPASVRNASQVQEDKVDVSGIHNKMRSEENENIREVQQTE